VTPNRTAPETEVRHDVVSPSEAKAAPQLFIVRHGEDHFPYCKLVYCNNIRYVL
jgi:hypothetical protein